MSSKLIPNISSSRTFARFSHTLEIYGETPRSLIKTINFITALFEDQGIEETQIRVTKEVNHSYDDMYDGCSVYLLFEAERPTTDQEKAEWDAKEEATKQKNLKELREKYENLKKLFEGKDE